MKTELRNACLTSHLSPVMTCAENCFRVETVLGPSTFVSMQKNSIPTFSNEFFSLQPILANETFSAIFLHGVSRPVEKFIFLLKLE